MSYLIRIGPICYSNPDERQIRLTRCFEEHIHRVKRDANRPDRLWGPPNLLSNGYQGLFPRG
jgi:hypothetical protein